MESEASKPYIGAARNLARKLLKDAGVNEVPVSLSKVIEHLKPKYDLEFIRAPLSKGVSGLLVVVDNMPTIGVNSDQALVRQRFTAGHEIGHLLLGHTCAGAGVRNQPETEAHQFAAELLMPLAFLRKDFKRMPNLDVLARKYVVSREALCRHLLECGVLMGTR